MALTEKKISNFASYRGAPSSDSTWDKLSWDFDAKNLKVIVLGTSTADPEMSIDGKDVHAALPRPASGHNATVYDFKGIGISRLYFRKTGATIEVYAYGLD